MWGGQLGGPRSPGGWGAFGASGARFWGSQEDKRTSIDGRQNKPADSRVAKCSRELPLLIESRLYAPCNGSAPGLVAAEDLRARGELVQAVRAKALVLQSVLITGRALDTKRRLH